MTGGSGESAGRLAFGATATTAGLAFRHGRLQRERPLPQLPRADSPGLCQLAWDYPVIHPAGQARGYCQVSVRRASRYSGS